MTNKRKKQPQKSPADISVGNIKGIGNVIGHESSSHVQIQIDSVPKSSQKMRAPWQWVRLVTFLIAVAGLLGMVTIFMRLLQSVETWALVQLVLATIVAALGISGTIKPQAVVELLAKLVGKE